VGRHGWAQLQGSKGKGRAECGGTRRRAAHDGDGCVDCVRLAATSSTSATCQAAAMALTKALLAPVLLLGGFANPPTRTFSGDGHVRLTGGFRRGRAAQAAAAAAAAAKRRGRGGEGGEEQPSRTAVGSARNALSEGRAAIGTNAGGRPATALPHVGLRSPAISGKPPPPPVDVGAEDGYRPEARERAPPARQRIQRCQGRSVVQDWW